MLRRLHSPVNKTTLASASSRLTTLSAMPVSSMCFASQSTPNASPVPPSRRAKTGPYRQVGNVLLLTCEDIPAKHTPVINLLLREMRLEFKGQFSVVPDTPMFREKLFRIRHVVRVEQISLDDMKKILGIPAHIEFSDLMKVMPRMQGRGPTVENPMIRYHIEFSETRKRRLRDIMARDQAELRLLRARKRAKAAAAAAATASTASAKK